MLLRPGTRLRPIGRVRGMSGASAWNPGDLSGTPREWLADPLWCYTDGSASFASASGQSLSRASNSTLQVQGEDFWWAGWVKMADSAAHYGIAARYKSNEYEWAVFRHSSGFVRFAAYHPTLALSDVIADSVATISDGAWAFVLAWRDTTANTINVKINGGTTVTSSLGALVITNGTAPFTLGSLGTTPDYPLNGNLAACAFGKSPPGGIAAVISTISSRLYASGNGIVYADTTAAERTAWGLVSWWDLVRSGVFTDAHGTNHLTNNNGVSYGAGLPRSRCGDTDPVSAWVDRWQGTTVSQSDPLKRPTLRLVGGKWCVRFDGVNDVLSLASHPFGTGNPALSFAVAMSVASATTLYVAIAAGEYVSGLSGVGLIPSANFGGGTAGLYSTGHGGGHNYNSTAIVTTAMQRVIITRTAGSTIAAGTTIHRNGVLAADNGGSSVSSPTLAAGPLMLGSLPISGVPGGSFLAGDIADIVVAPSHTLTSEEVARLDTYLGGLY